MLNEDEIGIVIGQISKRDEAGEQRNGRDQRDLCCTYNDLYCTPKRDKFPPQVYARFSCPCEPPISGPARYDFPGSDIRT